MRVVYNRYIGMLPMEHVFRIHLWLWAAASDLQKSFEDVSISSIVGQEFAMWHMEWYGMIYYCTNETLCSLYIAIYILASSIRVIVMTTSFVYDPLTTTNHISSIFLSESLRNISSSLIVEYKDICHVYIPSSLIGLNIGFFSTPPPPPLCHFIYHLPSLFPSPLSPSHLSLPLLSLPFPSLSPLSVYVPCSIHLFICSCLLTPRRSPFVHSPTHTVFQVIPHFM